MNHKFRPPRFALAVALAVTLPACSLHMVDFAEMCRTAGAARVGLAGPGLRSRSGCFGGVCLAMRASNLARHGVKRLIVSSSSRWFKSLKKPINAYKSQ
jgi:hypothetical protein